MKRLALDTNIAVDFLNGVQETGEKLRNVDVLYLPITVCGELYFGAANSSRRVQNERKLNKFVKSCRILHADLQVAKEYAAIRLALKQKGTPIPENDIWIAAICKVNKLTLATRDKHFGNIVGLKIIRRF